MKGLKKVCAVALSLSMLGTAGITGVQANDANSSDGSEEIRKVVFSEDFESFEADTQPNTVGGVAQTWGTVTDGTNTYSAAGIVEDDNGNKALQIGNSGMLAANELTEFISFGQTLSKGKYEITYDVYAKQPGAYSTHFMSLANANGARATWECLAVGYFWISHNGLTPGAPLGPYGPTFGEIGMTTGYTTVKMTVDFEQGKYQTIPGGAGGEWFNLNTSSVSGMKSTFVASGAYNNGGDIGKYNIDNIKVTKIYKLIGDLPIEDSAVFEKEYTLPQITPSADGVTYELSYTKDGEAVTLNAGDVLESGRYTVTIKATDGENTAEKTISFVVKPDVTYTDESEVVFSEDFENLTVGETPLTIGGAAQNSLTSFARVVDDNENKVLVLGKPAGSTADIKEIIKLDRTYNEGVYEFSYMLRTKNDTAHAVNFMRLANNSGSLGTYDTLIGDAYYFNHVASNGNDVVGGPGTKDDGTYMSVSTKVDFDKKTYTTTIRKNSDYIYGDKPFKTDAVAEFMTDFVAINYHGGSGDTTKDAEYYIDDIKVKEYYGLAVNLPFKTGEKYRAGTAAPTLKPAAGVEYTSVVYTKDGEPINFADGDKLTAGAYTMTVTATDGYNVETRTVKFEVTDEFGVISATTLDDGEKITAKVELSIPDSFTDDFDVIVVMKSADKISDIKSVNRNALQNETAVFTFDTPAEESYEFEYFVWNLTTLKPYTQKGAFTTLDPSL